MWSGFHDTSSLAPDSEKWSEWVEVIVVNFLASKMAECLVLWDQLSWRCQCLVSGIRGGGWVTVWVLEVCFGITFGSVVNDLGQLVFPYVLKLPSVCACVCVCVCVFACVSVHAGMHACSQSCLTLCECMDYSLPGFFVHGLFQARILEWVAISYSRGSKFPNNNPVIISSLLKLIRVGFVVCNKEPGRTHKARSSYKRDWKRESLAFLCSSWIAEGSG